MKQPRLLLPFVHGVDMCAIEQAILLAKSHEAVLVPLVLIYVPEENRAGGARLEHIQQSKDFLEAVQFKAARYEVPIERFEVFTSDIVQSINLVATEMACEGILLFLGRNNGILLNYDQIKRLVEMPVCKLYIMHLQTEDRGSFTQMLLRRFLNLLKARRKKQEESELSGEVLEEEIELSIH